MRRNTLPTNAHPRRIRRLLTVTALTVIGVLTGSSSAWAHLEVDPGTAAPGKTATITFRVPNESATASTTKVEIQIPQATPLATIRYGQKPGWTVKTTHTKLTTPVTQGNFTITDPITSVVYTATAGNGLPPGSYGDFSLTIGPLPDLEAIEFPSIQTYDNGDVVAWNEPTPPSGEEPEKPMPTLTITAEPAPVDNTSANADTKVLTTIALVIAAAALLVAALAWRRRLATPTPPNPVADPVGAAPTPVSPPTAGDEQR
jgi:uncharacterized protein YcnI